MGSSLWQIYQNGSLGLDVGSIRVHRRKKFQSTLIWCSATVPEEEPLQRFVSFELIGKTEDVLAVILLQEIE